jgi:phosphopantothenoylcysteine decarboxylase/phosphopantothenate--cysteine ligase
MPVKLKKGCDLTVANDVSRERGVFGGEQNTVQLVSPNGVESWGLMSKQDVAQRLMKQLAGQLSTGKA